MTKRQRLGLLKSLYRKWKNEKAHQRWLETSYRYDERSHMVPLQREDR